MGREPTTGAGAQMRTHPPIFDRLTLRCDPYGAVNVLARRLAHREPSSALAADIERLWIRHRLPRFPNYRSQGRDES